MKEILTKNIKIKRCFGGKDNSIYADYHDFEWGRPLHDDNRLFEMLILEGAQAGLNWEIVLKKRDDYRKVFHNFDIKKVARMPDSELAQALQNPKIIRNRLKIFSARKNAQISLEIQKEFRSLDNFFWSFVNNKTVINSWHNLNQVPAHTNTSIKLSKYLKKRGMSFVGATIMYAFMQAVGLVNDHLQNCPSK